ncbi:MAG TPA: glycosyltransferase, partial [Myxococcaceae bacterium]|nr:glycosyltransferase [Myxococcaceae bacterium]
PSRFESLSLVALEAFAQRTPVLVNGRSPVLTGQVRRSGAGFVYFDRRSFAEGVREIAAARRQLARRAAAYARKHRWARVVHAYKQEMRRILEARG